MAKIAILLDTDFEQVEYTQTNELLEAKGHQTTLITTQPQKQVRGLNHTDPADTFTADLLIGEANAADYDAIVLPGGGANADALRANTDAQAMVKAFMNAGKPVAAICHAPWIFADTKIARGKKLTAYKTIAVDLKNAGAQFEDKSVVVDGNLITSRQPEDIPDFAEAIDQALTK